MEYLIGVFGGINTKMGEKHSKNTKKQMIDIIIALVVLAIFTVIYIIDSINWSQHDLIGFDEAYNASVAANVSRYGIYKVSYPGDNVFYNMITTGVPVILPTALFYSIFGINAVSTSLSSIVSGAICIYLIWGLMVLLGKTSKYNKVGDGKYIYTIASVATVLFAITDVWFTNTSRRMIGEITALLFLLLTFICMVCLFRKPHRKWSLLMGVSLAAAFLTKSSMIFFLVSIIGMMIIETFLTKRVDIHDLLWFLIGVIGGFILLETYKIVQLGNLHSWIEWWKNEWQNMISQSSGVDLQLPISEKFSYLESIFIFHNKFVSIVFILSPIVVYAYYVIVGIKNRNNNVDNKAEIVSLAVMGVSASSLFVFFLLFGGNGLMYARRHSVNEMMIKCFVIGCIILLYSIMIKRGNQFTRKVICCIMIFSITALLFPLDAINNGYIEYKTRQKEDSYGKKLMDSFLEDVKGLPDDSKIFCIGWWQEPNISVFLDKKMNNVLDSISRGEAIPDNSYFIVGQVIGDVDKSYIESALNVKLEKYNNNEINYDLYKMPFDRREFDFFAIYHMSKQ